MLLPASASASIDVLCPRNTELLFVGALISPSNSSSQLPSRRLSQLRCYFVKAQHDYFAYFAAAEYGMQPYPKIVYCSIHKSCILIVHITTYVTSSSVDKLQLLLNLKCRGPFVVSLIISTCRVVSCCVVGWLSPLLLTASRAFQLHRSREPHRAEALNRMFSSAFNYAASTARLQLGSLPVSAHSSLLSKHSRYQ